MESMKFLGPMASMKGGVLDIHRNRKGSMQSMDTIDHERHSLTDLTMYFKLMEFYRVREDFAICVVSERIEVMEPDGFTDSIDQKPRNDGITGTQNFRENFHKFP